MDSKRKNAELHKFSDKLESLMRLRGITQGDLAEQTGISQSSISRYRAGKTEPGISDLDTLADFFKVPADFLLGRDLSELSVTFGLSAELAEQLGASEPEKQRLFNKLSIILSKKRGDEGLSLKESSPRYYGGPFWGQSDEAPLVSWASAGNAHAWEDQGPNVPRVKTNCKDPNCYALEVEGDSMEPLFSPKDVLVVAPNSGYSAGDLVVFKTVDEEAFFKKYAGEREQKHRFLSFNPKYPMMEFSPKELRQIHAVHSIIKPVKGKIF